MRLDSIARVGVFFVSCNVLAAGYDRPDLRKLFPRQAPVTLAGNSMTGLDLPPEVVAQCRGDLSDLRLIASDGREIAFAISSGAPTTMHRQVSQSIKAPVGKVQRHASDTDEREGQYVEVFDLEKINAHPQGELWELVFHVKAAELVRSVKVEEKEKDGTFHTLIADGAIYRVPGAEQLSIAHPAFGKKVVRVTLTGPSHYLEPTLTFESGRILDERKPSLVPLEEIGRRQAEAKTIVDLARPRGLVLDALRIETGSPAFHRPVQVWDAGTGASLRLLGEATLLKIADAARVEQLDVSLDRPTGDALRVEITDQDSPALDELKFQAVMRRPLLVFATKSASATLYFGGGRAFVPHYDLAAMMHDQALSVTGREAETALAMTDLHKLAVAHLGTIANNPLFENTPLLAFAMRPGAVIDRRAYQYVQKVYVQPSSEGLTRVRLNPEAQAAARPDLADVRIIDAAARQWPYLLDHDAGSELVSTSVGSETHGKGESHYGLVLPAKPMRLSEVIFETPAPYFNRAFELLSSDCAGGAPSVIAHGRLVRKIEPGKTHEAGSAVTIALATQRVGSLELVVHDGDDAPLALSQFRLRALISMALLTAPTGDYTILIGKPEEAAPQYELAEVREFVETVASGTSQLSGLEANPAYSIRARMQEGSGPSQVILWVVLGLAVLLLGGMTLRLARKTDPKP